MSLLKGILKIAAPAPKLGDFDRFLFIGPHPDDIEIGAGATAARLAAMGKQVCFLVCIDGRYGDGAAPCKGEELIALRQSEARKSAEMLGVSDLRFLGFCDGGFYEVKDLEAAMAKVIGDFKPQVIFAPDPCVTCECHADHLNVGNTARRLAYFAPYGGIMANYGADAAPVQALAYYMTAKANRFVCTKGYLKKQLDAIFKCHVSQFPEGCADGKSIALYLKLRAYDFGLRRLCGTAEGFRVLGVTQMHCFPEGGD